MIIARSVIPVTLCTIYAITDIYGQLIWTLTDMEVLSPYNLNKHTNKGQPVTPTVRPITFSTVLCACCYSTEPRMICGTARTPAPSRGESSD